MVALALVALFNLGVVAPVMALECMAREATPVTLPGPAHDPANGHGHSHTDGAHSHSHTDGAHAHLHAASHSHTGEHAHASQSAPGPQPNPDECCIDNIPHAQVALPAPHNFSIQSSDLIVLPAFAVLPVVPRIDLTFGECYSRDGPPGPRLRSQFCPSSLRGRSPPIFA